MFIFPNQTKLYNFENINWKLWIGIDFQQFHEFKFLRLVGGSKVGTHTVKLYRCLFSWFVNYVRERKQIYLNYIRTWHPWHSCFRFRHSYYAFCKDGWIVFHCKRLQREEYDYGWTEEKRGRRRELVGWIDIEQKEEENFKFNNWTWNYYATSSFSLFCTISFNLFSLRKENTPE